MGTLDGGWEASQGQPRALVPLSIPSALQFTSLPKSLYIFRTTVPLNHLFLLQMF